MNGWGGIGGNIGAMAVRGRQPGFGVGTRRRTAGPDFEEYSRDVNELTDILQERIGTLAESENEGDRQLANYYASLLDRMVDPQDAARITRQFRAGGIPGVRSRFSTPNMPPAWS